MRPAKKSSDGFTLIELLVAIAIFSLVVGMAMFSLRHFFSVVQHLDAPYAEETQRLSRLRDCVSSMFNYVTPSRDMFDNKKDFATFFIGESGSMTFVSSNPPSGRKLAVCRLSLVKGEVVLEEAPLYTDNGNYLSPSLDNGDKESTVIVSGASTLRLEYLRNGKKETSLKAALPAQVRLVVAVDGRESEYYYRIMSNFDEKALFIRGLHEPI